MIEIIETKKKCSIVFIRLESYLGDRLNIEIDFENETIRYKDGLTFNGNWKFLELENNNV